MKYRIEFIRFYEHLARVELVFHAQTDNPKLWMPTWIAGSYLIREFSKNITKVTYLVKNELFVANKINKNTFVLDQVLATDEVSVHYEVYCKDLSVRTAFVDHTRIFGNFSSLLLFIEGQSDQLAQLSLQIPKPFINLHPDLKLACGLKHTIQETAAGLIYQLEQKPAFELTDYPFEIGSQDSFEFQINSDTGPIKHRFFLAGRHRSDLTRLKKDLQSICQAYVNWLKSTPFDDYSFLTMVTGDDYGGLEHINSTALISPRTDLPSPYEKPLPSVNYQRFLGLCSHEYFHAWWVKSVRPQVMMDNDLTTETYTPLLWVFEGFTSYLDDLMLLVSGVIDKTSYLKLLNTQINRYYQTEGRHHQSLAQSSFDTWIKLYRPDENSSNQGVSYYNKGALVALLLDLTLLKESLGRYRLFDLVSIFYTKSKNTENRRFGMTDDNLSEVISKMLGPENWQRFYENFVIGTSPLPLKEMLADVGITLTENQQSKPWGMTIEDTGTGLKIKHIHRGSQAAHAHLSAGDTIIAIDGIRASNNQLKNAIAHQAVTKSVVAVHAFRQDELMEFRVKTDHLYQYQQISLDGDGGVWLQFEF